MRKIGNKKNQKYEDMRKYSDPKFLAKVNPQLGIDFSDDKFIKMGDGYAACVYVYGYPTTVMDNWLNEITTVMSGTAVIIDIIPQDSKTVKRNINKSMEEQQSRLYTARTNMESIDAQNRFAELEAMYDEIEQMGKVMDLICIRIFVPGRTVSECDDNVREVISTLDKYKAGVCLCETKQDYLAIFLPQSKQRETIYKKDLQPVPSRTLAAGNPFHFSKLIDPQGFYWGESDTGGNVLLDVFHNDGMRRLSYNSLILGIMGSGKSTILKKLIEDRAARGDKVRVFDVTGEYRDLVMELGGRVVSFDGSSSEMINILQILPAAETDQISYSQHIAKVSTIYNCLRPSADEIEVETFESIVRELYETWGFVDKDGRLLIRLSDIANEDFPILSDLYNLLVKKRKEKEMEPDGKLTKEYEHIVNIGVVINNCCLNYKDIFNGYTSISNIFSEQILCFDMRMLLQMKSTVFDAQMTNMLNITWADAVQTGATYKALYEEKRIAWADIVHTLIICDEIHRWLNPHKTSLVLMVTRFEREARKWFCGIALASQSLSDVVPEKITHEALENMKNLFDLSTYKFIMLQDSSVRSRYREIFGDSFSDWEIDQIPQLEQGETILSIMGGTNIKFKIYVPDESLAVYKGGA